MTQDWIAGAEKIGRGMDPCSGTMIGGTARVTLHTTEGGPFDFLCLYLPGKGDSPQVLWDPTTGRIGQFSPLTVAGCALMHLPGTVDTNRMGSVNVQIEVMGQAVNPFTDGAMVGWDRIQAALDANGVPRTAATFISYPDSAGQSRVRMSPDAWRGFAGYCGHMHVPGNDHGDPGNLDPARLLGQSRPAPQPQPPVDGPTFYNGGGHTGHPYPWDGKQPKPWLPVGASLKPGDKYAAVWSLRQALGLPDCSDHDQWRATGDALDGAVIARKHGLGFATATDTAAHVNLRQGNPRVGWEFAACL